MDIKSSNTLRAALEKSEGPIKAKKVLKIAQAMDECYTYESVKINKGIAKKRVAVIPAKREELKRLEKQLKKLKSKKKKDAAQHNE